MSAALDLSRVPPLGEPRPQPVPVAAETTLPSGLRVVVVPRPGVPLIELRLRVPFAASTAQSAGGHTARGAVLSGAVLLGTASHDQNGIAVSFDWFVEVGKPVASRIVQTKPASRTSSKKACVWRGATLIARRKQ